MAILVVDDEAEIRASLRELLNMAGYEVVTAASGTEALERMGEHKVRLMLVDLSMPGMSGEELIRRLCRQERRPSILAITALAPWQTAGLITMGVGYLRKPIDAGLLLGTIKTLLRKEHGDEVKGACRGDHIAVARGPMGW
jgi:DNA-binding response OmpR family regulator